MKPLKESYHQKAGDIQAKLEAIGADFNPVPDRKPALIEFREEESEIMAEIKHALMRERFTDRWKLGPRDPDNKTSPWLVD